MSVYVNDNTTNHPIRRDAFNLIDGAALVTAAFVIAMFAVCLLCEPAEINQVREILFGA